MKKNAVFVFITFVFVSFLLTLYSFNLYSTDKASRVCSNVDKPRQTIPKRIHQIWNDDIVPAEFAENVRGFVKNNPPPLWEYYYWTKESGLKFLADRYPYLYQYVMAGASEPFADTMRADILRYAVIYEYGGLYFDMDTISVKPLDEFVDAHACVVALEPAEHFFSQKTDFMLTNSALSCTRHHSFYTHLLLRISTLPANCVNPFACTGPPVITRLYREVNRTRGDFADLPDVQASEIFQDMYDIGSQPLGRLLADTCLTEASLKKLQPYQKRICENWKLRGMEKRVLSVHALSFHTWYHVYGRSMTLKTENTITNLVPHVKIYGRTLSRIIN